ncbi:hypothetical protein ABL78_3718 [Leptomonas seymouri]|uniref:FYVE-type domain-containing protein n=1 Tax=Leptomonas seymouri TaxID=5684 RepID=A0A0N1I5R6_LEPSE|nr:hypothetical protein ABL78_3718 [Leptomonas seymouri]|eukprot:KPI87202.1 hypothetical protein ABL78_3718 [Leptomonas seymouri]
MASFFGLSRDKRMGKTGEGERRRPPAADQRRQADETADQQPGDEHQWKAELACASDSNDVAEGEELPSAAATNNDGGAMSASGGAADSLSSRSSTQEKKDVLRYGSSYEGGADGRCYTCGLVKIACNCQHCHCCRRFLLSLSSRKHCRRCWRATCPKCSSHERTNSFLHGEVSRTCKDCAVPRSLVYLTELAYGYYETLNVDEKVKTHDKDNDKKEDSGARLNAQPLDARPLDARPFRWGLYALGCGVEAPLRCINPSCPDPISYDLVCAKCKLPTVTLAFHKLRHVTVPDVTDSAASSDSKSAVAITEVVENAVRRECDAAAAARTPADEDNLFDAALPNDMEHYIFASLHGDGWSSRKVLLSLVACTIAAESSAMPSISLAMTDTPLYARLLRPLQFTDTFSVFNAPGHVRYIVFSSGASNRSSVHQVLSTCMTAREAWTSNAVKQSKSVAKIVLTATEAHNKGLTECAAKLMVREGVLAYISENESLCKLPEVVEALAKEGLDIVLCGHGIGGAIASWITATLLLEDTARLKDRVMCVTYGAPLVANYSLTDLLVESGLHENFQHFVNASDVVPRMSYIDALLDSGNTGGTASIVGHDEGISSLTEVRETVVMWVGKHEEPHGASAPRLRSGDEGFSFSSLARKMRKASSLDIKSRKLKGAANQKKLLATEDPAGDIFHPSREPFDNNVVRAVDEKAAAAQYVDLQRFSTPEHRAEQTMDPFGCYHFLWQTNEKYLCTDDPSTAIGLLSDCTHMRVLLRDHLLSSYSKAMTEYIYSVPAGQ